MKYSLNFLDDSILNEYNESVKSRYDSKLVRDILMRFISVEGKLAGSNPFMLVYLNNSGLINEEIANRENLEDNRDILLKNYIDFGVALTSKKDNYLQYNRVLSKNLYNQLKRRDIQIGKGKLIPFSALKLREDSNSCYGLVFDLNENIEGINNLLDYKWDGMVDGEIKGISRACILKGEWYPYYSDLSISRKNGRVAVVNKN